MVVDLVRNEDGGNGHVSLQLSGFIIPTARVTLMLVLVTKIRYGKTLSGQPQFSDEGSKD